MKKFLCVLLCVVLTIPFLLVPVAAAPGSQMLALTEFGLYDDSFVYKGVLYSLDKHPSNYEPHYVIATPSYVYVVCVQMIEGSPFVESSLLTFYYDQDDSGELSYLSARIGYSDNSFDAVYYRFVYSGDDSSPLSFLDFVNGSENHRPGTYSLAFKSSYSDLYKYILVNRFSVYYMNDICVVLEDGSLSHDQSERSVFKGSNSVVLKSGSVLDSGFCYVNDGSYVTSDFNGKSQVYYLGLSFSRSFPSGPNSPRLLIQTDPDSLVLVLVSSAADISYNFYVSGADSKGDYVVSLCSSKSGSIRLVYLDLVFDSYNDAGLPVGLPSAISYKSALWLDRASTSLHTGLNSIQALRDSFFVCSSFPIYWSEDHSGGIFFWQNPRGTILDPNYVPIPPLDNVLPELEQIGGSISNDAIADWNANFSSISDFVTNFLTDFAPGIFAVSSSISLFADLSPVRILLYLSLFFGLFMLIFNLGVYLIQDFKVSSRIKKEKQSRASSKSKSFKRG